MILSFSFQPILSMSRKPRLYFPGALYHVLLRGNGGQAIFFKPPDYHHFYKLLAEGHARFDHRIHGFCLMNNHVHLAIQTGSQPLSPIMQNVSFRYTRWINKWQKRVGHLFQGRYKALLVDQERYLLALIRYIHLNPIRAGIVKELAEFPWSSHAAYLGGKQPDWLHCDLALSLFSSDRSEARRRYATYIHQGRGIASEVNFKKGTTHPEIIGEDHFVNSVFEQLKMKPHTPPPIEKIIQQVAQVYRIEEEQLKSAGQSRKLSEARAVVGMIACDWKSATIREVANQLNRDDSTISARIYQLRQKMRKSPDLQNRVEKIKREI